MTDLEFGHSAPAPRTLCRHWLWACRRLSMRPTAEALLVSVRQQRLWWLDSTRPPRSLVGPQPTRVRSFLISTSRFGLGQVAGSNCTPLGLHRIAAKIGAGWPVGTAFTDRQPVGFTWKGCPNAPIAHRILWLEGLEPGLNRGDHLDTYNRYIYIHGVGDESSLGAPASHGCIHMKASDIMPFFDQVRKGSMVWIDAG